MALIIGFGLFLLSVLTAALSRVIAEEFVAWNPFFVRWLIKIAVARLPENHRERFEEEWRSDVDEVPGVVGKLVRAADCSRAAYRMALDEKKTSLQERWFRCIERFDESLSKTEIVIRTIRDGRGLTSEQISVLNPVSDRLDRSLRDGKELRDRLAEGFHSYANRPTSLVSSLLYRRRKRAMEDEFNRIVRMAEITIERSDEAIMLLNCRTTTREQQ